MYENDIYLSGSFQAVNGNQCPYSLMLILKDNQNDGFAHQSCKPEGKTGTFSLLDDTALVDSLSTERFFEMTAMKYKGSVFIIFFLLLSSSALLAHSSSTKSFFWLGETEDMKKEKEINGGTANEVEERQVPTGSDPLHHNTFPFTSP
ncbi:CLAVATA3/ESR (CLE)-related protein 40 [Cardamine amara subsp. amara]|uniref:CLAVATA3/ESR (CLE)-related protein 40 n=1 Tax=Cardamine amara subsp. amara TaxID=228776 RepID=A0ABD0ZWX9_CARAN